MMKRSISMFVLLAAGAVAADLPVRMPFFPWLQIAGLVLLSAILVTMGLDTAFWNISWIVGVPWQLIARQKNGVPDLINGVDAIDPTKVGGFKTSKELDAMIESTGVAASMSANNLILKSGRSGPFS